MTLRSSASLWTIVFLGMVPLAVQAQNNPTFRGTAPPPATRPNYGPGYRPAPYSPAAYGGGVYTAGYGNSYSASLSGMADLTTAQGQYLNDYQSSRQTNQQVEQEKLKTRKMAIDEKAYEKSLIPPLEDLREQERQRELRRAMGDPPVTEIYTGGALNNILKELQDMQARGLNGPSVPLDPEVLSHINIASPTGDNVGAFKNGGKVKWPFALTEPKFDAERMRVDTAVAQLMTEAQGDGINGVTIRQYIDAVDALSNKVEQEGPNLSLSNVIQCKRQVGELEDAATALKGADPDKLINKTLRAQGNSVAELVAYMTKSGLKFGPSTRGDETAYRTLHYAMVTYDLGVQQTMARK